MTTTSMELYEALVQAGVDKEKTKSTAAAVMLKADAARLVNQYRLSSA